MLPIQYSKEHSIKFHPAQLCSLKSSQRSTCKLSHQGHLERVKHKKYNSCELQTESFGFTVKTQALCNKNEQPVRQVNRGVKQKLKQRTDCYNYQYMKRLQRRDQIINWIKYNITEGIFILWKRIKNSLKFDKCINSVKEVHQLQNQIDKVGDFISKISNPSPFSSPIYPQKQKKKVTVFLQPQRIYQGQIQQIDFIKVPEHRQDQGQAKEKIEEERSQECPSKVLHQIGHLVSNCQQDLKTLHSGLSLKTITFPTYNQIASRVNIQKYADQLHQSLKTNGQRFEMLHTFVQKLACLQQNKHSITFNLNQLRSFEQLIETDNLNPQMSSSQIESKIFNTIHTVLSKLSKHTSKNITTNNISTRNITSKDYTKKTLPSGKKIKEANKMRVTASKFHKSRASIEFRIEGQNQNFTMNNTANQTSKNVSFFKRQEQNQRNSSRKESNIFHNSKKSLIKSKSNLKKGVSIKMIKTGQTDKKKKGLTFAPNMIQIKKSSKKIGLKSMKSISRSKISSFSNVSCRSFISVQGFGTMRSINSDNNNILDPSIYEIKTFKSNKTIRQLGFLKGKLKKISCIRDYRSVLFKLYQQFSTSKFKQTQQLSLLYPNPVNHSKTDTPDTPLPQNCLQIKEQTAVQTGESTPCQSVPFNSRLLMKAIKKTEHCLTRKEKRQECIKQHSDERQTLIRELMAQWKQMSKEMNISKKKNFMVKQLQILHSHNLIPLAHYLEYKKLLNQKQVESQKISQQFQQKQSKDGKRESPYSLLLNLKKQISKNTTLSQTNDFYYRFDQFSSEEQTIFKTKQKGINLDDQFFNIKCYAENKRPPKMILADRLRHTMADSLFQKGI